MIAMIETPFGPQKVLDAHTHFFGHSFYSALAKQAGLTPPGLEAAGAGAVAHRLGWDPAPADAADAGERWAEELDRHGVDRAVSIHTLPGDLDSAARGVAAAGKRLAGFVMVNPLSEGPVTTVDRAVRQHGFRGVALFPSMFGFPLHDDRAQAVLEMSNRHKLLVFVHCGVLKVGFRDKLNLPATFDLSLSNPLALRKAAAQFPNVRFVLPHLGSGMFRELLMLADSASNVFADTSGIGSWGKYLDGRPSEAQVLRHAVEVMGAERLLFGTDSGWFPRGWRRDVFDAHLQVFEEARLDAAQVGAILGANLDRLLGA
jgi:predicted TIM-barrel fold metal-dependent hydrolase